MLNDKMITLNVYIIRLNGIKLGIPLIGVYHSGVAIRGREYAYGGGPFGSGGVWMQPPEFQQVFCVYKESIDIGECKMKWKKIKKILVPIFKKYNKMQYKIISNNCNDFTNEVCMALCNKPIPSWVNRPAHIMSHFFKYKETQLSEKEQQQKAEQETKIKEERDKLIKQYNEEKEKQDKIKKEKKQQEKLAKQKLLENNIYEFYRDKVLKILMKIKKEEKDQRKKKRKERKMKKKQIKKQNSKMNENEIKVESLEEKLEFDQNDQLYEIDQDKQNQKEKEIHKLNQPNHKKIEQISEVVQENQKDIQEKEDEGN